VLLLKAIASGLQSSKEPLKKKVPCGCRKKLGNMKLRVPRRHDKLSQCHNTWKVNENKNILNASWEVGEGFSCSLECLSFMLLK